MKSKRLFVALMAALLIACGSRWEAVVVRPDGTPYQVTAAAINAYLSEREGGDAVALERVLWWAGHALVESVAVTTRDGVTHTYDWAPVAADAWWEAGGDLVIAGERLAPTRVQAQPSKSITDWQATIMDIAPTSSAALGIPSPELSEGRALATERAARVLLLFLDGLGYVRYMEALAAGDVPHLAALDEPLVGITVYPPVTRVATAALLTGASPEATGVTEASVRSTEAQTLFDVATEAGLEVVAVEGQSVAFNLRNAEVILSGDRDGDGSTDDNVLENALAVLERGRPDLLFVHFHGIDDNGHTYGPGAPEEIAAVRRVDEAVGRLLDALPARTLVLILADHGMHQVEQAGRLGDHKHLIERDMLIPIWVLYR